MNSDMASTSEPADSALNNGNVVIVYEENEIISNVQNHHKNWINLIDVNFEHNCHISQELRDNLAQKQRPKESTRRELIRHLVNLIRAYVKNPKLSEIEQIASRVVLKYPKSLADQFQGTQISTGYASLSKQIRYRFDFLNRGDSTCKIRLGHKRSKQDIDVRRIADSYGCTNFQPPVIDEASLTCKKMELKGIYKENPRSVSTRIGYLSTSIYPLARRDINSRRHTQELLVEHPYLFVEEYLLKHFELLTNVKIYEMLGHSISTRAPVIFKYISQLSRKKKCIHDAMSSIGRATAPNVAQTMMLLTMSYFGEAVDSLIILVDVSKSILKIETFNDTNM